MTRVIKISEIRIKGSFENSNPNAYKLAQCREYWNQHRLYLHDIVVNQNGYLVDGYIQYLVLKENDIEDVSVKDFDKKIYKRRKPNKRKSDKKKVKSYRDIESLYVFGVHPGRTKERVWRVPYKFQKKWEDILKIGDILLVKTKYGKAPVRVTSIKRLRECPVDIPVKKVIKILNNRKED